MDPLIYIAWKYMTIKDMIAFTSTCKDMYQIVTNEKTWRYLLVKDYDFTYDGENPRRKYTHLVEDMVDEMNHLLDNGDHRGVQKVFDIARWNLEGNLSITRDVFSKGYELDDNLIFNYRLIMIVRSLVRNRRGIYSALKSVIDDEILKDFEGRFKVMNGMFSMFAYQTGHFDFRFYHPEKFREITDNDQKFNVFLQGLGFESTYLPVTTKIKLNRKIDDPILNYLKL